MDEKTCRKNRRNFQVILVGVRRYPAVDHRRRDARLPELSEKIGPQLRLGHENGNGVDPFDHPSHDEGIIEGEVKYGVGLGHPLARGIIARDRHGGKDQLPAGILFLEFPDKGVSGHHFSHGHRVHPDRP